MTKCLCVLCVPCGIAPMAHATHAFAAIVVPGFPSAASLPESSLGRQIHRRQPSPHGELFHQPKWDRRVRRCAIPPTGREREEEALMGKRSTFERVAGDFYPTPFAAVPPLIPHLRAARVRTFAEPCCGDGALILHLESSRLRCVYQGDISAGQDALVLGSYGEADAIITNPPYARPLMHALIAHFQRIAPTWLLLEMDWAATRQAEPFLPSCSDIVVVGRLRLIEGTKHAGKENFGWFRFTANHASGPILHPRVSPSRPSRSCGQCGASYRPQRADSRFCSDTCRQRAHRARITVTQP